MDTATKGKGGNDSPTGASAPDSYSNKETGSEREKEVIQEK